MKKAVALKVNSQPRITKRAFAAISAVEGLRLSPASKARLAQFEAQGLSLDERRKAVLNAYKTGQYS